MKKFYLFFSIITLFVILISCGKKTVPAKTAEATVDYKYDSVKTITTTEVKKDEGRNVAPRKTKAEFPKVISVNDAAAKKSVDGRMYYDIQGRRYWKNFKDGKYYIFDKTMYSDPDFKPAAGQ